MLVLLSAAPPVWLFTAGEICSRQIDAKGIERAGCITPPVSYASDTPEYKRFVSEYKSLIQQYFDGWAKLVTAGVLLLYLLGLVGATLCIFFGNPIEDSRRALTAAGLIFSNTILAVLVFSFPLGELVKFEPTFMLIALVTIPAAVGMSIYFLVFNSFQRRQQELEDLLETLCGELQTIYPDELPSILEESRSNAEDNLQKASEGLRKNVGFIRLVQKSQSISEEELRRVENEGLSQVKDSLDQIEGRIETSIGSALASTHLDSGQVQTVFNKLLREPNQKVFTEYFEELGTKHGSRRIQ